MLETPHVAVGVAIASKIPNPIISIPVALASHFILDIIPHWNPHINREIKQFGTPTKKSVTIIRIDSVAALIFGTFFAYHARANSMEAFNILACSFAAVLPDVVEAPYYFLHKKTIIIEKWIAWQKSIQADAIPAIGLTTQAIIILASLVWILG